MKKMKPKTIIWLMSISMILIVCGVGYYIGITMAAEMVNHPEITEIGAPPDLRITAVLILIATIFCGIALKTNPVNEKETK